MRSAIIFLILFIASVAIASQNLTASTCGGNCPGGNCPSCPCGITTSPQTLCSQFSGWDQQCCQCIVQHESGGNANADNYNSNGSFDVGVWQINQANWGSCSGGSAPCNVGANLQCAVDVWKWGGGSFKLWSTCGGCGCCSPSTSTSASNSGNNNGNGNGNSGGTSNSNSNGNSATSSGSTYSASAVEAVFAQPGGAGQVPANNDAKAFKL